ncbi:GNAT family N-acetyltransferase [Nocardiopsis composta]|uniref:RimJ/RimL family protein N-acetyltransferase n=1 Tax=Nocardiopsis composta TaxID=157465 RepID=A0A7W8VC89_9ACTN|nr:GNAT family protein [Nocardiopsis composta]MBB5430688.1 RimJ/RimL family protein N-acetyltransferase [Nocardiopsis composta]
MDRLWTGRTTRLRGVEPGDWRLFQEMDTDTALQRGLDAAHPPRSEEGYRAWTAEQAAADPDGDTFRLVIEPLDGRPVGAVSVDRADPRTGLFQHGIAVTAAHRRSGHATQALRLLLGYMFGERRHHKCEAHILAGNTASLALHLRLGFTREGLLRDREFFAGRHHDTAVLGLTAPEFHAAG